MMRARHPTTREPAVLAAGYRPHLTVECCRNRSGFSLIEIIIATAILMGSVVVLARLAGMGRTMAQKADLQAKAQRVCEQTLNEIVLGQRPLQPVDRSVLEPVAQVETQSLETVEASNVQAGDVRIQVSGERWLHSVFVTPLAEMPQIVRITVTVEPAPATETVDAAVDDTATVRKNPFTLSRWVRGSSATSLGEPNAEIAGGF